jgi:hypothetical protein
MARMIRCALEQDEFPEVEFEDTVEHGLVHHRGRLHTTLGDYVEEDPLPGAGDTAFRDAESSEDLE